MTDSFPGAASADAGIPHMKIVRGAELGRLLPRIEQEASDKLKHIGRFDGANVLLRLFDAWEDLALEVDSEILRGSDSSEWNRARYHYALLMMASIEEGLNILLNAAPEKPRYLFPLPQFRVEIVREEEAERITSQAEREKLYFATYQIQLLGRILTRGITIMMRPTYEAKYFAIDLVLEWLRMLRNLRTIRTALRFDAGVLSREDADFDIRQLVDSTRIPSAEEILAHEGFDMRSMMGGAQAPEVWAGDLRARIGETMPTVALGIHSEENIREIEAQVDAIRDGYLSFPNFDADYLSYYGHNFTDFVSTCRVLLQLARDSDHSVYCDFSNSLTKAIETSQSTSRAHLGIVESMVWKPREDVSEFPIIRTNGYDMFQFGMILSALRTRPKIVYDSKYNNDPKGKVFESRCGKILSDLGFDTVLRDVPIVEGFMPGKTSTDIDVLARKGDFVLVLECKQEKFRIKDRFPSGEPSTTENDFKIYATETYWRGVWVANRANAAGTGDETLNALLSSSSRLWIVPLVVTTYPIRVAADDKKVGIITFAELATVARDVGRLPIVLSQGQHYASLKEATLGGEEKTIVLDSTP